MVVSLAWPVGLTSILASAFTLSAPLLPAGPADNPRRPCLSGDVVGSLAVACDSDIRGVSGNIPSSGHAALGSNVIL